MGSSNSKISIDAFAALLGRHVLKVNAVFDDLGIQVDRDSGVVDVEDVWAVFETGARRAVAERQARKRASRVALREADGADSREVKRNLPDQPLLSKLAEVYPELFPRARVASPEDRDQALLYDYRDQLAEVNDMVDEFATPEFLRKMITNQFEEHGFVIRREGRSGAVYVLTHPEIPGQSLKCGTYIAMKKNRFAQTSFVIRRLDDESIRWVVLFARPLRKMYLIRTADILARFAGRDTKKAKLKDASLTIRKGTPDAWLFENPISELIGDFKEKTDNSTRSTAR